MRKYIKQFVEGDRINYMKALKVLAKKGYQRFIPHKHDLERSTSPLKMMESPLSKTKKIDFYPSPTKVEEKPLMSYEKGNKVNQS